MYLSVLDKYKAYLEKGTYEGQDFDLLGYTPKSRFHTFDYALTNFVNNVHRTIVELGTIHSYVGGGHPHCMQDVPAAWKPNEPEGWDWGAGFFSKVAADTVSVVGPHFRIHTVDLNGGHINRCRLVTSHFKRNFTYHCSHSVDFLKQLVGKIDLLYMDAGDLWPLEETAQLNLAEAQVVVERQLISQYGLVVIDDVRNTTPLKFGETSKLGRAKYSLSYFLEHGYEIVLDEYQLILRPK